MSAWSNLGNREQRDLKRVVDDEENRRRKQKNTGGEVEATLRLYYLTIEV